MCENKIFAMKKYALLALGLLLFSSIHAQNSIQQKINALSANEFASCSFGVQAMYEGGTVIAGINAQRKLNPASNMKVLTTGAALLSLGPDYHWETILAHSGEINRGGTLNGDLYIIGGGDPMMGSRHKDAVPLEQMYGQWASFLEQAGIKKIKGDIIGDGSWLHGDRQEQSWSHDDIGTYYGTCISGLNFYENRQSFKVSGMGKKKGEALDIQPTYPNTPWMQWKYECRADAEGGPDQLYMFGSEDEEGAVIRGTFGAGMEKEVHFRNNFPERTLALDFKSFIENRGISVSGIAAGVRSSEDSLSIETMAGGVAEIGCSPSPSLLTAVNHINKESNNMFAEVLFRTLGQELGEGNSPDAARTTLGRLIAENCRCPFTSRELIIQDGCGLSGKNRLSPDFMCRYLCRMKASAQYENFRNSLVKYSQRCYYKSGSFTGCRCLCGYLLPSAPGGKTIVFSIMVNNSEMKMREIDRIEKQLLDLLCTLN